MQRRILNVMVEKGYAAFTGERARKDGFGVFAAKHGGVLIRAYQSPQYFLNARHLIRKVDRIIGDFMVPGTWYEITDDGREALL